MRHNLVAVIRVTGRVGDNWNLIWEGVGGSEKSRFVVVVVVAASNSSVFNLRIRTGCDPGVSGRRRRPWR